MIRGPMAAVVAAALVWSQLPLAASASVAAPSAAVAGAAGASAPDLKVQIAVVNSSVVPGQQVTFRVRLDDQKGTAPATGVKVTSKLSLGTIVGSTAQQGSCAILSPSTVTCDVGTIYPASSFGIAETIEVGIIALVPATGSGNAQMTLTATATENETDLDPSNNTASKSITLQIPSTNAIDLATTIDVTTGPVAPGERFSALVTVADIGTKSAGAVTLTSSFTFPAGTTVAALGPPWACAALAVASGGASATLTCTLSSLAYGTGATVVLSVTPPVGKVGTVAITATASTAGEKNIYLANNTASASVAVKAPDLVLALAESIDPVGAHEPYSYVATVGNIGPTHATRVRLGTTLVGATFVSAASETAGRPAACDATGCDLGDFLPGEAPVTVRIRVTAPLVDPATGTATASERGVLSDYEAIDADPTTDTATEATTILRAIYGIARCGTQVLSGAKIEIWSGSVLVLGGPGAEIYAGSDGSFRVIPVGASVFSIRFTSGTTVCGASVAVALDGTLGGTLLTGGRACDVSTNTTWVGLGPLPLTFDPIRNASSATVQQALCAQGQSAWFKIPIKPGSRVIATLTGANGGTLPANYDLFLYRDLEQALTGIANATDALRAAFGGDTFGGDTFGGDTFGGDTFGGDTFGGDTFGGGTFGGDTFGGDTFGGDTFGGDTFGGDTFGGDTFGGDTFGGDTFGGDTFGSLIRASAHNGDLPEGLWQNTWGNTGFFYLRVRGRGGQFASDAPFTLTVRTLTSVCEGVPSSAGPSAFAMPATAQTLILTHSGRYGAGADATAIRSRLSAYAAASGGVVIDLAGLSTTDALAQAYATWDAHPGCPYAANVVSDLIRGLVQRVTGVHAIVIAGPDGAIPFRRIPDLASIAKQSQLVIPLGPNGAVEAGTRFGYFFSDDFYAAAHPILKNDHELYVPDVPIGRLSDPASIAGMVDAYLGRAGALAPGRADIVAYDFWTDSALDLKAQLIAAGLTVNAAHTAHDLIQTSGGPTAPSAWTAADLLAAFADAPDVFVADAHGIRATELLTASYQLVPSSDILAVDAAHPGILAGRLVLSGACNVNFNIPGGEVITGVTPDPGLSQMFQMLRATTVGATAYAYGDDQAIAYTEALMVALVTELRRGSSGEAIRLGDALVRAKHAYVATHGDLSGIDEKALEAFQIIGFPTLAITMGGTRLGTVGALPLATGDLTTVDTGLGLQRLTSDLTIDLRPGASDIFGRHELVRNRVALANVDAYYYGVLTASSPASGLVSLVPAQPVLPRFDVPLRLRDAPSSLFARGALLYSATYSQEGGFFPLVSVPADQLSPVRPPFYADDFFPARTYVINYLSADGDFLVFNPAQYRSDVVNGGRDVVGTERTYPLTTFRVYYSSRLDATGGVPTFTAVSARPRTGGGADIDVVLSDSSGAGIVEAYVTYTTVVATGTGTFTSVALARDPANALHWTGSIPTGAAADLRFLVQAANGLGRVGVADNAGHLYPVDAPPTITAPKVPTALAILAPAPNVSVYAREPLQVRAALTARGSTAIAGKRIVFRLGGERASAVTGADGVGSATLQVTALPRDCPGAPCPYTLDVEFGEDAAYLGSSARSVITVVKEPTSLVLTSVPVLPHYGDRLRFEAGLADRLGRPLSEQNVIFVVSDGVGHPVAAVAAETDYTGTARAQIATALDAGDYTLLAAFGGTVDLPGGTLTFRNARYLPASPRPSVPFTILKADPVLRFTPEPIPDKTYGDPDFAVSASSSNGFPVALSAAPEEDCTLSAGTVHLIHVGPCSVTAAVDGDKNWNPASVTETFAIRPATGILVLNAGASGALSLSGGSTVRLADADLVVDSSSPTAATTTTNSSVTVVGGTIKVAGGASGNFTPAPIAGSQADPLAGYPLPSTATMALGATYVGTDGRTHFRPGRYDGGISVQNGQVVVLDPGLFVLRGGGLSVSGGASINGDGVMIFNTTSAYPGTGTCGKVDLSGSSTYNVTAPATNIYVAGGRSAGRGMLLLQDPACTTPISLTGKSSAVADGTVYAPTASVKITGGSGSLQLQIIAGQLAVSGGAAIAITLDRIATLPAL